MDTLESSEKLVSSLVKRVDFKGGKLRLLFRSVQPSQIVYFQFSTTKLVLECLFNSKVKLNSNGLLSSVKMLIQIFHILLIPLLQVSDVDVMRSVK